MTFLMAQANFKPTFSCINTSTILKPSYYSSYLPAYEDGTDRVFRNVGIQNSDAGELPRRKKHTTTNVFAICGMFLNSSTSDTVPSDITRFLDNSGLYVFLVACGFRYWDMEGSFQGHHKYGRERIGITSESGRFTKTVCEVCGFIHLSTHFFMYLLIISTSSKGLSV
jgi:hypothetical protein